MVGGVVFIASTLIAPLFWMHFGKLTAAIIPHS